MVEQSRDFVPFLTVVAESIDLIGDEVGDGGPLPFECATGAVEPRLVGATVACE